MSYELTLPNLGENIDSADVVHVFVDVGDQISTDQDLIEVETGKASMPIPSTVDGSHWRIPDIRDYQSRQP